VSRQREYQLRQHARGLCAACPNPVLTGWYCVEHAMAIRVRQRERRQSQAWQPGKPGRPPAEAAKRRPA